MVELTKEQVLDKIRALKTELAEYEKVLDNLNDSDKVNFSKRMKSMVGGCFIREFGNANTYYRIDAFDRIEGNGLHARCLCAYVALPKYANTGHVKKVEFFHFDSHSIDEFIPISKEDFQDAINEFNNRFHDNDKRTNLY